MSTQVGFALRGRNPDVLSCIANLSNDEVFTPPEFANSMLDSLAEAWAASNTGASIWSDPNVRFLDPCAKSGVFLREITSRLTHGLEALIPDLQERVDHILTRQIYGIGMTQLTSLLARRSVYCSKKALGEHSICKRFASDAGNIWYESTSHTWLGNKCAHCGAGKDMLDRSEGLETHAYAFIHANSSRELIAKLFGGDMQFDVVIGNPPYQLSDGGYGTSASPIYQLFVEKALDLDPRFAVFVTPSRWMSGGKGLDEFRNRMLKDKRMRSIVDYPKLYEAFPGVKIRGGVSYFVWDKSHHGPCEVQTIWDGQPTGPAVARNLDAYDVLVRRNEAVPILEKVRAKKEATLEARVSSRKPFGLPSTFRGRPTPDGIANPVKVFATLSIGWARRDEIPSNPLWVDDWKVLMTKAQGTSAAVETKFLSRPIIAGPGTACTETYLVAGRFTNEVEAKNFAAYLRTRLVRFLVSLRKATQNAAKDVYAFVPDLSVHEEWTDVMLYKRYGLTKEEIAFIESQVAEQPDDLAQETPDDDA